MNICVISTIKIKPNIFLNNLINVNSLRSMLTDGYCKKKNIAKYKPLYIL